MDKKMTKRRENKRVRRISSNKIGRSWGTSKCSEG
jgi:hypothetical protein